VNARLILSICERENPRLEIRYIETYPKKRIYGWIIFLLLCSSETAKHTFRNDIEQVFLNTYEDRYHIGNQHTRAPVLQHGWASFGDTYHDGNNPFQAFPGTSVPPQVEHAIIDIVF
jgi:hypothetical protein